MRKTHPQSFKLFLEQVSLGNQIRWYVAAGGSVLAFFSYRGTSYLLGIAILIFLMFGAAVGFEFAYRRIRNYPGEQQRAYILLKRLAFWQVFFDLILITMGVHMSGGPISHMPLLYIVYFGAISIFFPSQLLIILNTCAIVMYIGLIESYHIGIITPIIPPFMEDAGITLIASHRFELVYIAALLLNEITVIAHSSRYQHRWHEANERRKYLNNLHGLTKMGLEHYEAEDLYKTLANYIHELLGSDGIYITRWDSETGYVYSAAVSGEWNAAYLSLPPTPASEVTMTRSVRLAEHPLVAEDVSYTPYNSQKVALSFSYRSLLGLPMIGVPDKRFLGAMLITYNTRHYFDPEEIERAQQAADIAALLISRTRLYQETLRRADLLQQLALHMTNLTSDLRQTTLLPTIVEVASSLLHAQRAALHLYDRTTKQMRCEFSIGLSDDYLGQITQRFNQIPGAQVLHNKTYVLIPDVHQDSRTSPIQDLIAYEKFRAYAVFALSSPQGSLGALTLYWDQPHVVSSEEIDVAVLFAQRAGALLHNARLYEQASEESLTDALTGLPNRRAFDQRIAEEVQRAGRYGHQCALLMLDLDGFKAINDCFGHPMGDSALKHVADGLRRAVRSTDFLCRYGGDEFAVILPESEWEKAISVAKKLKAALASIRLHLPNESQCHLSACIGVAIYPTDAPDHEKLLSSADQRLYRAKRTGKGTIIAQD